MAEHYAYNFSEDDFPRADWDESETAILRKFFYETVEQSPFVQGDPAKRDRLTQNAKRTPLARQGRSRGVSASMHAPPGLAAPSQPASSKPACYRPGLCFCGCSRPSIPRSWCVGSVLPPSPGRSSCSSDRRTGWSAPRTDQRLRQGDGGIRCAYGLLPFRHLQFGPSNSNFS